ncbi:MAG: hypothetical protein ACKVZH_28035 [Blastocatellia bacterium]
MTTLEQILQNAKQLPLEEQRALVTLLDPPPSLEKIAAEQGVGPFDVESARRQAVGIWPEDESLDDFAAWLRESRQENREREIQ